MRMGQGAAEIDSVLFEILAVVNERIWRAGEGVVRAALTPSTFEPCGCSVCRDPSSNTVEPTQPSKHSDAVREFLQFYF
jgi:hypothetical protein